MINRFYRDEPDRMAAELARRAARSGEREPELGRQIARILDPGDPHQVEELARIGTAVAALSPAAQERLLASVPGMDAERVREALRPWLHPVPARPTPTDSIERAPDFGPFAGGTAARRAASEGPETGSVGSLEATSRGPSPTPVVVSRAVAWRDPVDGDRAAGRSPRPSLHTALPETSGEGRAAMRSEREPPATEIRAEPVEELAQPGPAAQEGASASVAGGSPPFAYVGETPVEASWLGEREAALVAIRADYEAARGQALAAPGAGPGWQTTFPVTDENGQISSAGPHPPVWLADPSGAQEVVSWSEGEAIYRPVGRWVQFDEEAFAAHYRALGGEPLQRLAAVYDPSGLGDAASLLAAHPELWSIATADHALNAGPPLSGFAMADAGQLGMLDLYLADSQIAALVEANGGTPTPAASGIAAEQVRLFGERRFEQMSRLAHAMASVRAQYTDSMAQAQQAGSGPGWGERELTRFVSVESGDGIATGQPVVALESYFDPDAFTDWYVRQGGLQHEAFAGLYGRSHTQYGSDGESGRTIPLSTTFDNPNWWMSGGGGMLHRDLLSLDPSHPPRLRDDRLVGFDLEAGWSTPSANLYRRRDWVETALQVAVVAAVCYVTAGTLGPVVSSAASSAASGYGAAAAAAAGAAASAPSRAAC